MENKTKQKNIDDFKKVISQSTSNGMINKFFKNKKSNQKGYAILFTVVIVSAISVITAGLSNTAYKQLVLSSLAKDSQAAFYEADTAADCALYADRVMGIVSGAWTCGGNSLNITLTGADYTIYPTNGTSTGSCFRIDVTKDDTIPNVIKTRISAKGYNICNTANLRTVEREVVINFQEEF